MADYGRLNPAIDPAFNDSCVPACTVLTCSCTRNNDYWPSTGYGSSLAWFVSFDDGRVYFQDGSVGFNGKSGNGFVRASAAGCDRFMTI